jgi:methenyltetrahydromethanopterin cyclohydrolase
VRGGDAEAEKLAQQLPSNTCSIYGKPFAEIFAAVGGDFYKIDASLFSPALVTVSNLDTGSSFHAGKLAPDIVDASFR